MAGKQKRWSSLVVSIPVVKGGFEAVVQSTNILDLSTANEKRRKPAIAVIWLWRFSIALRIT